MLVLRHGRDDLQLFLFVRQYSMVAYTATSIRFAQHEHEGHNEKLIALIVADM